MSEEEIYKEQEQVIDEMAECIYLYANLGHLKICDCELEDGTAHIELCKKDKKCIKCIKQYFINKLKDIGGINNVKN